MTREFIDGFELGTMELWDSPGGGAIVDAATYGMNGAYCANNGGFYKYVTAREEYYTSLRVRMPTWGVVDIIKFFNTSTLLGCVKLTPEGRLTVNKGDTLITTGNIVIPTAQVVRIETYYKPDTGSGGVFQVKINGVLDIDFTGITSLNALQINCIELYGAATWKWDDIIFDSANWIGNTKIQAIVPNGAGTTTEFTPSAGSNYQCVDEIPAVDTDYVSTNIADKIDTYAMGNMVAGSKPIDQIKCIQLSARAKLDGAATPTKLALGVRTGGTNFIGADQNLQEDTWKRVSQIWEENPDTTDPWTKDEIDAIECGQKSRA